MITVVGEMAPGLRAQFDDVEVTVEHGLSRLVVVCPDPSVLHGLLHRVDVLDLELIDVRPMTKEAVPPSADAAQIRLSRRPASTAAARDATASLRYTARTWDLTC